MNHSQKISLGRKMQTPTELRRFEKDKDGNFTHQGIFTTVAWEKRKADIATGIAKRQAATHQRALDRKEVAGGQPRIMTRARIALQNMRKRAIERRRARQQRYDAKHATV